ncbi:nucleolar protein 56-like isoform X3 [Battus philenor]|uniref:nucleolar protein 56-like isoform X3 n=1 Tax=Battus philenor TaxID=42288 RepID=UPI0035CFE6CC
MRDLHVLYEHNLGYFIFRVLDYEKLEKFQVLLKKSMSNVQEFSSIVTLTAFECFKSSAVVLENMIAVSENIVSEHLKTFLQKFVVKEKWSRWSITLGVCDQKVGTYISHTLKLPYLHTTPVPDIIKGIQEHFHALVPKETMELCIEAQSSLGEDYSIIKDKYNQSRLKNLMIRTVKLQDQLHKDVDTASTNIRELYSNHFPELVTIVEDNYLYSECVKFIADRTKLSEESFEPLFEILGNSEKVEAIIKSSKMSGGKDISKAELININVFTKKVGALVKCRGSLIIIIV